jgi:hypothetical protein
MDETVYRMLEEIAVCCPQYLRVEDWRRLYRFAMYAHMQLTALPRHVIRRTLMQHGCSLQKAGFLESEILRFMELLEFYDEYRQHPG